jgi:hypothetical protein
VSNNVLREFLVSLGFKVDEVGMKKFVDSVDGVTKKVRNVGLAVSAAATGVVAGVKIISSQMENLYYASQRTGATVGNIMALRYAAGQIGLTADQAQGSLENFARTLRLNPGSGSLLDSLGVKGGNPAERFTSFIEKMKSQQPYVAAAYAGLFGIDPDTLLMLENGLSTLQDEQKKYAASLTRWGIDPEGAAFAGKEFNNSIRRVISDFDKLWIVIESKLVPVMTPLIDRFEKWAETHAGDVAKAIADSVQQLANWIDRIDWDKTTTNINKVVDALGGVKGILIGLAAIKLVGLVSGVASLAGALGGLGVAATAVGGSGLVGLLGTMGGMGLLGYGAYKAVDTIKENSPGGHFVSRRGGARPDSAPVQSGGWSGVLDSIKHAFNYGGSGHFVSRAEGNAHGNSSGATYDPQAIPALSGASAAPLASRSTADLFAALEKKFGLPPSSLDKVWNIESGRGKTMLSPVGAKGHFQFMDATAKQYGVADPNDLTQSATGAASYIHDLMARYEGDIRKALAAYNWGQGNLDKDIAAHGADWEKFLPNETAGYLNKFDGARLGSSSANSQAVSMNQTNMFTINGSSDPQGTARAVSGEQSRVNGDLVRNFAGAFR